MSNAIASPIAHDAGAHPIAPPRQRPIIHSNRLGMWWFLASEIVTFGGVVVSYLLLRLAHPEWIKEAGETILPIGVINTVVLLTSSLTVVLAHGAAERKDLPAVRKFLVISLLLGLAFLCFKGYEYHHEIAGGHTPSAGVFWGFYFCMTGLHGLHVVGGLIAMAYLIVGLKHDYVLRRVTPVGLYWHFVDIVWIFLFPLLYVTSH